MGIIFITIVEAGCIFLVVELITTNSKAEPTNKFDHVTLFVDVSSNKNGDAKTIFMQFARGQKRG